MKFLGGDNVLRNLDDHLLYLERCAFDWQSRGQHAQAEWVRRYAENIAVIYGGK